MKPDQIDPHQQLVPVNINQKREGIWEIMKNKFTQMSALQWASLLIGTALEIFNLSWLTPVCRKVIRVFGNIDDLPLIGLIWPDTSVADCLAFLQALLIAGVPVLVFKAALASDLLKDTKEFFADQTNWVWFTLGISALAAVFSLELYNLSTAAELDLNFVSCDPSTDPLCNPAKDTARRNEAKEILKNAVWHGVFVSSINMAVALMFASIVNAIEKSKN